VNEFGGRAKEQPTGTTYNIWYNKWAGGERFNPQAIPMAQDIFGRDRFRDERDDMGGVGSFEKDNRTLYLGQLGLSSGLEDSVYKHFVEWGELEYIRVLTGRGVAFVKYKLRTAAEFAKEAMNCQSMDQQEILNVRWATEDPNPKAAAAIKRKAEDQVMEAMKVSLPQVGDKGTILDYQGHFTSANEALSESNTEHEARARKHLKTEDGYDTANGFFYHDNAQAAILAAGAGDQANQVYYDSEATTGGMGTGAVLKQAGGAEYVIGVGNSRWYTGVGQAHFEARKKIEQGAVVRSGVPVLPSVGPGGQAAAAKAAQAAAAATAAAVLAAKQGYPVVGAGGGEQDFSESNALPSSAYLYVDYSAEGTAVAAGGSASVGGGMLGNVQQTQQQQHQQKRVPPPPPPRTAAAGAHLAHVAATPVVPAITVPKGIVSASTFQYLAEMGQRKAQAPVAAAKKDMAKPAAGGIGLIADYGSDDDE
ncbi:Pre-mRNA-splicing factor, partial [Blyttiomyces sp. JEL0837]